ncbi:MAG: right-handed parallel beta-helix repeat-containing protein [Lentimicrobium sp.]|nr:right-handed parallel beta-helix repeat-containing protein [Lentimicrobium sp.]
MPCNLYRRTSFTGLRYGIYAMGKSGGMTFKINNAEFIKNDCGIYASRSSNIEVKNTDFIIVKEGSSAAGLYLDNSTGFIIEENEFKNIMASGSSDFSTGIIVNNSGASDNFLYKNSFSDIKYGIKAQNKNRNSDGSAGLVIKCNIFQNVKLPSSKLKSDPNATE